jgi:hypothetical protein
MSPSRHGSNATGGRPQSSGIWHAGALLYSGRPDPRWVVPPERVDELMTLWRRMPVLPAYEEPPPRLGYRGCWLEAPDGPRWIARDGAVACRPGSRKVFGSRAAKTGAGTIEARRDEEREFERAVLATAPAGTPLPSRIPS